MRAIIQFINPDKKLALATRLLNIIKGITNLRQHILAHGIVLERLSPGEVATLQEMLSREDRFTYLASESTIRVRVTDGDLRALLGRGLVVPLPRRHNYFADIFWERGFTLEKLEQDQAYDLRNQIGAIATVTLAPDVSQARFCTVSGQVFQTDGIPLTTRGFTVRAFNSFSAGLTVPRIIPCGTTASLQANGRYLIDYAWHPDGRKAPDLIVRFLSGKTAIPFDQLNYLRLDAQWTFQHGLEQGVAYGLFRQELPTNLRRLRAEKPSRLSDALKASLARNIIPASIGTQANQIIEQLLSLADSPAPKSYAQTP